MTDDDIQVPHRDRRDEDDDVRGAHVGAHGSPAGRHAGRALELRLRRQGVAGDVVAGQPRDPRLARRQVSVVIIH